MDLLGNIPLGFAQGVAFIRNTGSRNKAISGYLGLFKASPNNQVRLLDQAHDAGLEGFRHSHHDGDDIPSYGRIGQSIGVFKTSS